MANGRRRLVAYPGKRPLIVLTSRPPQLETPFEAFDEGLLTPNDAFFVRYHHAGLPTGPTVALLAVAQVGVAALWAHPARAVQRSLISDRASAAAH